MAWRELERKKMLKAVIREFQIHSPKIEVSQHGYIVTVARRGHSRCDLTYHHDRGTDRSVSRAYNNALATVESVKRGSLVFSRREWSFILNGKTLTCTKFVAASLVGAREEGGYG